MAFNTKEQEIIKWGLSNGKSKDEVSRAITNYRTGIVTKREETQPSFGKELKNDLDTRVERTGEILARPDTGIVEKGVQLFGQGAGLASNIIEKGAEQIPGVKKGFEALGSGLKWLSETPPIKAIGEKIGGTKAVQELTNLYDTDQNFKDTVDAVANIARLGGEVDMVMRSPMFIKNVTNKVAEKTLGAIPPPGAGAELATNLGEKISNISPKSPEIMNRVARLNPKEFETFKKISGKTPGEYLTETGNFKAPDGIIQTEGKKFIETLAKKDAELAKLPGTFKDGSLSDALEGLIERARATSGTKTKSPYLNQVLEWQSKLDDVGLTMDEINKLKRLYEREVKLGYNKLTNGDKVQQATNIDSALRKFQDTTAKELGFTNLEEINKQIQISKYLADKLGAKIVGQSGLNGVSITDWIILAGGDPTAVASFLTKKFFSSKGVQAKIAELLNKEGVKGLVSPEVTTTPMSIERTISPTGAKQLPAGKSPVIENRVPIELRGKFEMEKGVPKTSTKSTQLKSKTKSRKASPKSTTKSLKVKGEILPTNYKQYSPELISKIDKKLLGDKTKAIVIDADVIKKMHPEYDVNNPSILHEESSTLSKQLLIKAIDEDASGIFRMTGGGSGSGKSEVTLSRLSDKPGVVFDGTLANIKSASEKIDYALSKGKQVEIHPTYTPVELATLWNESRARTVPLNVLAESHAGFRNTLPELITKYGDKIKVVPYENKIYGVRAGNLMKIRDLTKQLESYRMTTEQAIQKATDIKNAIDTYGIETIKKIINQYLQL